MRRHDKLRSLSMAGFVVLLAAVLPACRGNREKPVFPVHGKVLVNNQPAAKALVIFSPLQDAEPEHWPKGYPRGIVQDDGTFQLTSYRTDDGAPAGDYVATVLWLFPVEGDPEAEVDKLQGRYADPKASTLRVTVNADTNGTKVPPFQLN